MFDPDQPLVLRLVEAPASKPVPAAQPEKQFHRLFDGFKSVEVEHYSGERWSDADLARMRPNVGDGAVRFR